jgi:hypothetical protein
MFNHQIRVDHQCISLIFEFLIKNLSLPIPKFFGRFSNNGFVTFLASTAFDFKGAAATLFLPSAPLPEPLPFLTTGFGAYK